MVDEQDPLQVIEFVLQADRQQSVGIQLLRLSLEILVLEGMREILEMQSPVIICELHRHLGDAADKVVDLLFRSHYLFLDEHSPDRLFLDRAVLEGPHGPNRIIAVKRSLTN